ncbi:MAG TPA: hypothetical protein VGD65_24490 [Chryseosolibacter sp.]
MKLVVTLLFASLVSLSFGQKVEDLFRASDTPIHWLGVDFSKVQLVGDFSQFGEAGKKSTIEIKNRYFPGWNELILNERDKYDIKGMIRKEHIIYSVEMVSNINATAATEDMETHNARIFSRQDIERHVQHYQPESKSGIGIVFIAEVLNKAETEAWFHFAAIDLSTNTVLLTERLRGTPAGIGLRNYWAGAIYDIIKEIKDRKYREWKSKHSRS